jgi:hypothetical protein
MRDFSKLDPGPVLLLNFKRLLPMGNVLNEINQAILEQVTIEIT